MVQYPLRFVVESKGGGGIQKPWVSHVPALPELVCAIPPEFEGPGGGLSPEDLFGLAVANCFAATLRVIAEKSRVAFEHVNVAAELTVDRDGAGRPWMSAMTLKVTMKAGETSHERVLRVLEKTSQSCLVIHSIRTPVTFEFVIS